MNKEIKIISFHSQKGGVGKSTLSLYSAIKLNLKGFSTYLLDLDLTGAGLGSLEQYLENSDNNINKYLLRNPFREKKINILKDCAKSFKPRGGLNDILEAGYTISPERLFLLPTSSKYSSIQKILPFIYKEYDLKFLYFKIKKLLDEIINFKEDKIAIVIDNSPGIWGISKLITDILSEDDFKNYDVKTVFITTTDKQDFTTLLEHYSEIQECSKVSTNYLLFNKLDWDIQKFEEAQTSFIQKQNDKTKDYFKNFKSRTTFINNNEFFEKLFKDSNKKFTEVDQKILNDFEQEILFKEKEMV